MSESGERKELIIPVERTFYLTMKKRYDRQKQLLRIQTAVILLLIVCSLFYVIGNMTLTETRQASNDELMQQLKQQGETYQLQVDALKEKTEELQEENARLREQVEKSTYPLTSAQRQLVAGVVTAEAENQGYTGQVLVAQCIRNAAEIDGLSVEEVLETFSYAKPKKASESALQAVSDVFDSGYGYTEEPILYFYAPGIVVSDWHEGQRLAVEYKDHRFFTRNA